MKSKFLKKIIAVAVIGTSINTFVSPNAFAVATNDFYAWQNMNSGQSNGIWKLNNGKWYFLNYSGTMQTGWIYDKGKWYYADYTGVMQTGVIQINGKIHLFSESGAMQTGNAVVNGKYYSFDGNGVAVGKDIPTPINSFDLSGSTTVPYTPQMITNEDSSPSDPNTVARDPDNLIKYNVKFKDDDGDEFSTKTIEKDEKLTLYKPSKSGYTFVEWTTKKDGDGDSYEAGESITIKKDITLYAQWKESSTSDPGTSTDKVLVEDITVTSTAGSIGVGGTLTMSAKVLPINATEKGVTWSVSDSKIASISSDGVLTANAVGTVIVVATANDTSKAFGSTSIEVKVVAGAAVTGLDGELQIGATVTATAATTEAGAGTWTSSDPTVATVNGSTGVVTALKAGTTTISYTTSTSGKVNSKAITVKAVAEGAAVTGLDGALQIGATVTATAATTEAGAGGWESSVPTVAAVDPSTGVITALKAGTTKISYTTSTSGRVNSKIITVKVAAAVDGAPITLDAELQMGATMTATAVTTEAGASGWKSSNPLVATINENTGAVTALKDGFTTISYTTSTSGNKNSKDIIVKKAAVTASASTIATKTGTTTITLGKAITGLVAGDIVVKKGATALVKGTDYTLSSDLTGTTFDITFLAHAALDDTSVVTVEMTKAGYTINGGAAISVGNTISSVVPISIKSLTVTLSGADVTVAPVAGGTMKYILASSGDIIGIVAGKKATDTDVLSLGTALISGIGLNTYAYNGKYVVAMEVDGNGYVVAVGVSAASVSVAGAPTVVVSGISFSDTDYDANQIGGAVIWMEPNVSNVTNCVIYTSTDGTTKGTKLGEVAIGTKTFTIPADTNSTGVKYIAIYTKNATGEAANGVYQVFTDAATKVTIGAGSVAGAIAGNGEITGLTATTKYVVTEGSTYYGVLANGTLSTEQGFKANAEALAVGLTGTKITGLVNTKTYKVEVVA